jgi:hypothetical protein
MKLSLSRYVGFGCNFILCLVLPMLLIHWTPHNTTSDILANGIRPSLRQREGKRIRGVWCYPYTRNKFLNQLWKRQLKSWSRKHTNFNGIVFRLEPEDFPLYVGPFWADLETQLKTFPGGSDMIDEQEIDLSDLEIILPKRITQDRIIKVIKDREKKGGNSL